MAASAGTVPDSLVEQIRQGNAVFSAFRTHRMQNDMARRLLDQDGRLKRFDVWMRDIRGISGHYVRSWLQTEYSTAVIRARQAADWRHFEQEADVLPNLRWMPTTSPNPESEHRQYWERKLTLPVGDPFWDRHRPGDRWNCKCSLMQTDEPATPGGASGLRNTPGQPGLDSNPGKDGQLFSMTHPYYTQAYPGAEKAVRKIMDTTGLKEQTMSILRSNKQAANELAKWYKANLPETTVGKFKARRFVIRDKYDEEVIINSGFYDETVSKYKSDPLFKDRVEAAKKAHILIRDAEFAGWEESDHHPGERIRIYKAAYGAYSIRMVARVNNDGIFLHYLQILK